MPGAAGRRPDMEIRTLRAMILLMLFGGLMGACAGAATNQKPMRDFVCPVDVLESQRAGAIHIDELYDNPDLYGCRMETEEERLADWHPTNYIPWVLTGMTAGAVLTALFARSASSKSKPEQQTGERQAAVRYCRLCGQENPSGSRYCNGCGEATTP